jgi:Restriction endonuclease
VDLLVAMGYGGPVEDAGKVVGKSGDGGIDGIIKQDKLGLDYLRSTSYYFRNWRTRSAECRGGGTTNRLPACGKFLSSLRANNR